MLAYRRLLSADKKSLLTVASFLAMLVFIIVWQAPHTANERRLIPTPSAHWYYWWWLVSNIVGGALWVGIILKKKPALYLYLILFAVQLIVYLAALH